MKKHFLMFLLTLLPLAGWAQSRVQGNDPIDMSDFQVVMDGRAYSYTGVAPYFNFGTAEENYADAEVYVKDPLQTTMVAPTYFNWVIYDQAEGGEKITTLFDAGTYYLAAEAKEGNGIYTGASKRTQFRIDQMDIASEAITFTAFADVIFKNANYTVDEFDFTNTLKLGEKALVKGTDYEVAFAEDAKNAGEVVITFTALNGNFKGTRTEKFTIKPKNFTDETITVGAIASTPFRGPEAYEPAVTITDAQNGPTTLVAGTDYEVVYPTDPEALNAGDYTLTIKGKGNYTTDERTATYKITARSITHSAVKWANVEALIEAAAFVYDGTEKTFDFTGKLYQTYSGRKYIFTTDDYEVTYANNIEAGVETATVTFTGKRNLSGSKTYNFSIGKKPVTVTCTDFTVSSGANIEVPAPTFTTAEPNVITEADQAIFDALSFTYAYGNTTITSTTKAPAEGVYDYTITNGEAINNAIPNNYTYTFVGGKMTVSGAQIWAAVNDVTVTYGTGAAFDVTYVSGLADGSSAESYDGLTGNAGGTFGRLVRNANLTFKVVDSNKADVTAAAVAGTLNAGTYTITATGFTGTDGGATYLVSFKSATLTVNPFDLENATATLNPTTFTYKGAAWEPTVTLNNVPNLALEVNAGSYEVTYQNNINASTDENPAKAIVTAKENTNYTGSIEIPFTINKAELRIIAKDATYSISEIANGVTYEWWIMESDLLGQDVPTTEAPLTDLATQLGFTGNVLVKHNGNKNVGVYENYLIPYADAENPATFTNYTAVYPNMPGNGTAGNAETCGTLTITAANLVASVVPSQTKKYGEDLDAFSLEYVSGLPTGYESSFDQQYYAESVVYIVKDSEGNVMSEDAFLPVGTYTVEFDEDNIGTTTSNYIMKNAETLGTITIEPRPITLMPADQTIEYGQEINEHLSAAVYGADTESSEGVTVFVVAPAEGEVGGFADGEDIDGLGVKLVRAENTTGVGLHKNAISVADGENVNPNYAITYDNKSGLSEAEGNLTVLRNSDYTFYLDDTEDDNYEKIADFNGEKFEEITVYLSRSQELGGKVRSWNAEQWQALVLPFDVTIRELSAAFGYAIVNVVNPDATKEGDVRFKLQMTGKIAANTPFLIKLDVDLPVGAMEVSSRATGRRIIDVPKAEIIFKKAKQDEFFTIVDPGTDRPSVNASTDDSGFNYKFVGAYTDELVNKDKSTLRFLIDGNQWAYIMNTSSAEWNIDPLNAYVDLDPEAEGFARDVTFTMEEMGGQMTSIRNINADDAVVVKYAEGMYNLNGMKMDGAPVQKGVYILNGKKIVVK